MWTWGVSAAPLNPEQLEYRHWLASIERNAILPIKWMLLFGSLVIWMLHTGFNYPPPEVFGLFFTYGLCNMAFTYFFLYGRVTTGQIKVLCLASFLIDLIFVTLLVYRDSIRIYVELPQGLYGQNYSSFFVLYFIMIFRGFALFQTRLEGIILSILILGLFGFSAYLTRQNFDFLASDNLSKFALQIFMLWLMVLIAWFIVEVIRGQQTELRKAHENLVRSESLAMVGEMASGVAHEVNNPIGIISAYAETLLRQSKEDDPRREDLQIMAAEAQRCKAIVGELLSFARPTPHRVEPTDLEQLNEEVLKFVFHDSNGRIDLRRHYSPTSPVSLDPMQIKQALVNIYLNARQAIEDSGEISVTLKPHPSRTRYARMTIQDNGPGVATDALDKAFEPFFTRKEKGTGLGLSITKRIIDSHGGQIQFVPRADGQPGAQVEISLPLI